MYAEEIENNLQFDSNICSNGLFLLHGMVLIDRKRFRLIKEEINNEKISLCIIS